MLQRRLLSVCASCLLIGVALFPLRVAPVRSTGVAQPAAGTATPTPGAVDVGGCRTTVSRTLSASAVRECEPVTVTTRVTSMCRACPNGLNVQFIINSAMFGIGQRNGDGVLDELEKLRKTSTTPIRAGIVYYQNDRSQIMVPLSEDFGRSRSVFAAPPVWAGYGGYEKGASTALRHLQSAADPKSPRCDIIVFFGSVKEHGGPQWQVFKDELLRAGKMLRADQSTLMVYCTGFGEENCRTVRLIPESQRYYSEGPDVRKIPQAVRSRSIEMMTTSPAGLRSLTLDQHLPKGLTHIRGSALPPLSEIVTGTLTTTLRWHWDRPAERTDVTTTYRVRPAALGKWRIGGAVDVAPRSGQRHQLPIAPLAIHVTDPCAPTPTDVPPATDTPTPTDAPSSTATATPTPTPTPTPSATPTPLPGPIYLPISLRERCSPVQRRIDVVLVIDASTSMLERTAAGLVKLDAAEDAARAFLDQLNADDQAAIVAFNADATLLQGLTSDRGALDAAIAGITAAQRTCIVCAVEVAAAELASARRNGSHTPVLVLLTDGKSNPRPASEAVARAAEAKAAGVVVFTIGVGTALDADELAAMASRPEYFYRAPEAEDLIAIYRAIAGEIPCPAAAFWGRRP